MIPRDDRRADNPFVTRRVRPGALPYQFPPGLDARQIVERLRAAGWRGAVVGPHGSGKSTLLAALAPLLAEAGRQVVYCELHDGQRSLPVDFDRLAPADAGCLIVVDGYEQLSWWSRWRLNARVRRRGWGLLVTSHVPLGLPTICTTKITPETALAVLRLLAGDDRRVGDDDLLAALATRGGNLRDALFDLYDLYEQRRPTAG